MSPSLSIRWKFKPSCTKSSTSRTTEKNASSTSSSSISAEDVWPAYQWADQFCFNGKVRRIGKNVVHVLAVFVEDDTVFDRLAALKAVTGNLPEYHTVKTGLSKSYAEYLVRPFKVIKTATRHIDLKDGASDPLMTVNLTSPRCLADQATSEDDSGDQIVITSPFCCLGLFGVFKKLLIANVCYFCSWYLWTLKLAFKKKRV